MRQLQQCWDAAPLVCLGAVPWVAAVSMQLQFTWGGSVLVLGVKSGPDVLVQVGVMQGKRRVPGAVQREGPGRQWGEQGAAQH